MGLWLQPARASICVLHPSCPLAPVWAAFRWDLLPVPSPALATHLPRVCPIFEWGSLESLHLLPFRPGRVCTYGSGWLLRGEFICYILITKPASLFHVPILLLVLQLFRSTRCPARPAAHFRPRPGPGGGRAMYVGDHI